MAKTFDVGIESLGSNGGSQAAAHQVVGRPAGAGGLLPLPLRGGVTATVRLRLRLPQGSRSSWKLLAAR